MSRAWARWTLREAQTSVRAWPRHTTAARLQQRARQAQSRVAVAHGQRRGRALLAPCMRSTHRPETLALGPRRPRPHPVPRTRMHGLQPQPRPSPTPAPRPGQYQAMTSDSHRSVKIADAQSVELHKRPPALRQRVAPTPQGGSRHGPARRLNFICTGSQGFSRLREDRIGTPRGGTPTGTTTRTGPQVSRCPELAK